jgi:hypothetical protein
MLDITRFAKVLALAGSDIDGEALAALRKVKAMLSAANLSFTDVAQSLATGGGSGHEADRLRKRVADLENQLDTYLATHLAQIAGYEQELKQQRRRAQPGGRPRMGSLKRTRAEIETNMRGVLGDAQLSQLSDREIARNLGLAPQTVGNWRRRLATERRTVHSGRRRRAAAA